MAEVKKGLANYFDFYNERRWHHNFNRKIPAEAVLSGSLWAVNRIRMAIPSHAENAQNLLGGEIELELDQERETD
jgi:hypothetical protein